MQERPTALTHILFQILWHLYVLAPSPQGWPCTCGSCIFIAGDKWVQLAGPGAERRGAALPFYQGDASSECGHCFMDKVNKPHMLNYPACLPRSPCLGQGLTGEGPKHAPSASFQATLVPDPRALAGRTSLQPLCKPGGDRGEDALGQCDSPLAPGKQAALIPTPLQGCVSRQVRAAIPGHGSSGSRSGASVPIRP